ncbi:ParB/RepB/Spo0J family partition protein [Lacinutrix neustonica]|uniref:ParB/RepB/Spo0J family partition protein n=1 Tax=Lacinutrix neustonica TaxID=2980107 RepID=A0A9E8MUF1_9FLAO|nr:ParB/RepB/Spo0J family partition protein [Lacinutrix neustonica]WAC01571.1 ParB/RepB/Spo0J family partition protein [Lacinutrix neustonica]
MTTKASTTRKRSQTKVTAKVEVNGKKTPALQIQNLSIGKIIPDPMQPRKTFNEMLLLQLSESIKKHGVLQPITVRKSKNDYVIVMGERRYRASKLAGKKTIPCIVRTYNNNDVRKFKSSKICKDRMLSRLKKPRRLLT